ncbi:MAG: type II toxin-antitoxin system RelE/ParE family toxin [Acetobacteraceae bacterium]|nr:type II toxin-antitoxin system RelE/ParE family toxin [Acetobacteraceae bacterium]
MPKEVIYAPEALADLEATALWLTQPGSGPKAWRRLTAIRDSIERLREQPCLWPAGQHAGTRELPCDGGYRTLYEVHPDTGHNETAGDVFVLRVSGPGQDRRSLCAPSRRGRPDRTCGGAPAVHPEEEVEEEVCRVDVRVAPGPRHRRRGLVTPHVRSRVSATHPSRDSRGPQRETPVPSPTLYPSGTITPRTRRANRGRPRWAKFSALVAPTIPACCCRMSAWRTASTIC